MEPVFRFKKFSVRHDRCAHKVGTDGVLLGAWTSVDGVETILDIGTGSGVIALMLAQRTSQKVVIDAVEPEEQDFLQARENVMKSSWSARINLIHSTIQEYQTGKKYDLIVSNPPFFSKSLSPPSQSRRVARHTESLSHAELLLGARRLLSDNGKLSVVLPTIEGNQFQFLANANGLFCTRQLAFYSRKKKPQERWLMEFGKQPGLTISEALTLHSQETGEWSEEYKVLTRDFYLARD